MTLKEAKEWIDQWMSAGGSWNAAELLAQLVTEAECRGYNAGAAEQARLAQVEIDRSE